MRLWDTGLARIGWLLPVLFALAAPLPALAGPVLHVDSRRGDDRRDGATPATALRTLRALGSRPLAPGTVVLLRAGSRWTEPLRVTRSGTAQHPIVYRPYGRGARPRIDAGGVADAAVTIVNAGHVRVSGLELTNQGASGGGAKRRGVSILAHDIGTLRDIRVDRMFIHDVNGSNDHKDTGGIVFETVGARVPSRFAGLVIERNLIRHVDRSGIVASSDQLNRARWFPSIAVVIRDNYLEDMSGDGITPWATDGALVEHNVVRSAARRAPGYNAGLWQWSTDNTLIQLNDVADTHGTRDGQGYDSDYNSRGTTFLYNYSHGNEGGFMLLCTPVRRDPQENIGNSGTIVRHNISHDDRTRTFALSGADDVLVERNAVYTPAGAEVQLVLATDWDGWSSRAAFVDNLFVSRGRALYGHQVERDIDRGTYVLAPGWGPARDITLSGNRLIGTHVGVAGAPGRLAPLPLPPRDWTPPALRATDATALDAFMARHRAWLLALMRDQFGAEPVLAVPVPFALAATPGRNG
ncbi:hypothetical protein ASE75_12500 [Sphingomonas sp. Leaf17]|uniref:right-handed parallel beta-helix repeat-containing protein n=1 Tax=Sphingomonas sp. Leaf17 TaxID=1735683 RepID=UPI000701C8EC|nr:right-handed parallel beta-helix repeat-containing protein [Sphingomonas sp. Leaf17]KQM63287.1 hypothetical protein ASE75_12500 [Sphingomonas sp. Leaf17]